MIRRRHMSVPMGVEEANKSYFLVTAIVFSVVGLLHLLRIVLGWEAVVGGWSIPMWLSWVAIILTAVLAYLGFTHGWRER